MGVRLLTIALLLPALVWAQAPEPQETLENGKAYFDEGRYGLAMDVLRPITNPAQGGDLAAYAGFYYGLSAFQLGEFKEARQYWEQTLQRFPGWKQADELRFWLSRSFAATQLYELALQKITGITSRTVKKQAEQFLLINLYFATLEDVRQLYAKHGREPVVAEAYAYHLAREPRSPAVWQQLDSLIDRHDLDPRYFGLNLTGEPVEGVVKIALLLPFFWPADEEDIARRRFIFDMYQGAMAAQARLRNEGVEVQLLCYDTKRSAATTQAILADLKTHNVHMIVGPLFPEPLQEVNRFCLENQVYMLNPLTDRSALLEENPFAYLLKSTRATLGRAMGAHAPRLHPAKVKVYYEDDRSFQQAARLFQQGYDSVGQVLLSEVPDSSLMQSVQDTAVVVKRSPIYDIGHLEVAKELGYIDKDADKDEIDTLEVVPTAVALFGAEPGQLATILSANLSLKKPLPLFGDYQWVQRERVAFSSMEGLEAHLYASTYIDYTSKNYTTFRNNYVYRFGEAPSLEAALAFEAIWFFAHRLEETKGKLAQELRKGKTYDGFLMPGFRFGPYRDNQYLGVLEFPSFEFRLIDQP